MSRSYSSTGQPLYIVAIVMIGIAFGVGYLAGKGGMDLGPSGLGSSSAPAASEDGITVNFSPHGGCTERVVDEINKAQHEIEMQAYSFTSQPITQALIAAHHRGVKVTIVLDKNDVKDHSNSPKEVAADGITTFVDDRHSIAHNKIILIDGQTIITGSFNFTNQAERNNAENLLVLHGRQKLYAAYDANFKLHRDHSESYASDVAKEPASSRSFR